MKVEKEVKIYLENLTVINLGASKVLDIREKEIRSPNFKSWFLGEQGYY